METSRVLEINGKSWIEEVNTISNLTIKNGYKAGCPYGCYSHGGGLFVAYSNPTISNIVVENNFAEKGGGIYLRDSNADFDSLIIRNNKGLAGVGVYIRTSEAPSFTNSSISNNHSQPPSYNSYDVVYSGMGFYSLGSSPVLNNVEIYGNYIQYQNFNSLWNQICCWSNCICINKYYVTIF